MEDGNSTAFRLNEIRKEKNITVAELAEKVNISPAAVSKLLNGINRLSDKRIGEFCDVLGIKPRELSIETENPRFICSGETSKLLSIAEDLIGEDEGPILVAGVSGRTILHPGGLFQKLLLDSVETRRDTRFHIFVINPFQPEALQRAAKEGGKFNFSEVDQNRDSPLCKDICGSIYRLSRISEERENVLSHIYSATPYIFTIASTARVLMEPMTFGNHITQEHLWVPLNLFMAEIRENQRPFSVIMNHIHTLFFNSISAEEFISRHPDVSFRECWERLTAKEGASGS